MNLFVGVQLHEKFIQMLPDLIGIVGVACTLSAYILLHLRHWCATDLKFSCVNAMGSSCILFSLFFHWNLSSALVEMVWFMVSSYGIFNFFRLRYQAKKKIEVTPTSDS